MPTWHGVGGFTANSPSPRLTATAYVCAFWCVSSLVSSLVAPHAAQNAPRAGSRTPTHKPRTARGALADSTQPHRRGPTEEEPAQAMGHGGPWATDHRDDANPTMQPHERCDAFSLRRDPQQRPQGHTHAIDRHCVPAPSPRPAPVLRRTYGATERRRLIARRLDDERLDRVAGLAALAAPASPLSDDVIAPTQHGAPRGRRHAPSAVGRAPLPPWAARRHCAVIAASTSSLGASRVAPEARRRLGSGLGGGSAAAQRRRLSDSRCAPARRRHLSDGRCGPARTSSCCGGDAA